MTENQQQQVPVDTKYLPELMAEKDSIDPSFVHAVRLITSEIERIQNPQPEEKTEATSGKQELVDTNDGRPVKHSILLKVPVDKHPTFNYVGRFLGPGGSTLKGIQSTTSTQIAILGKGSMRDKKKAEELAAGGDAKFQHLNLPLHVKVTSVSSLDQALMNIGGAVSELIKLMQPTNEDEMMMMSQQSGRGMGQRGGGMRGRGGRGGASGRGGAGRGGMRGGRGGASQRGTGSGRGRGSSSGSRGGYSTKSQDPYAAAGGYDYPMESYEGYGAEYGTDSSYDAYGQEAYADAYSTEAGYGDASYGADAYGYGDGSYDAYGNGAEAAGGGMSQYGGASQQSSKPFRGKMRGSSSRGRASSKPY